MENKTKNEETNMTEPKTNIFFRLCIIAYEFGDLCRDIVYAHRFPNEHEAHMANAKLSLADLLTQLSIICKELGFNETELRELGVQHLREKHREFEKRRWVDV
jgi:hypothetical protein